MSTNHYAFDEPYCFYSSGGLSSLLIGDESYSKRAFADRFSDFLTSSEKKEALSEVKKHITADILPFVAITSFPDSKEKPEKIRPWFVWNPDHLASEIWSRGAWKGGYYDSYYKTDEAKKTAYYRDRFFGAAISRLGGPEIVLSKKGTTEGVCHLLDLLSTSDFIYNFGGIGIQGFSLLKDSWDSGNEYKLTIGSKRFSYPDKDSSGDSSSGDSSSGDSSSGDSSSGDSSSGDSSSGDSSSGDKESYSITVEQIHKEYKRRLDYLFNNTEVSKLFFWDYSETDVNNIEKYELSSYDDTFIEALGVILYYYQHVRLGWFFATPDPLSVASASQPLYALFRSYRHYSSANSDSSSGESSLHYYPVFMCYHYSFSRSHPFALAAATCSLRSFYHPSDEDEAPSYGGEYGWSNAILGPACLNYYTNNTYYIEENSDVNLRTLPSASFVLGPLTLLAYFRTRFYPSYLSSSIDEGVSKLFYKLNYGDLQSKLPVFKSQITIPESLGTFGKELSLFKTVSVDTTYEYDKDTISSTYKKRVITTTYPEFTKLKDFAPDTTTLADYYSDRDFTFVNCVYPLDSFNSLISDDNVKAILNPKVEVPSPGSPSNPREVAKDPYPLIKPPLVDSFYYTVNGYLKGIKGVSVSLGSFYSYNAGEAGTERTEATDAGFIYSYSKVNTVVHGKPSEDGTSTDYVDDVISCVPEGSSFSEEVPTVDEVAMDSNSHYSWENVKTSSFMGPFTFSLQVSGPSNAIYGMYGINQGVYHTRYEKDKDGNITSVYLSKVDASRFEVMGTRVSKVKHCDFGIRVQTPNDLYVFVPAFGGRNPFFRGSRWKTCGDCLEAIKTMKGELKEAAETSSSDILEGIDYFCGLASELLKRIERISEEIDKLYEQLSKATSISDRQNIASEIRQKQGDLEDLHVKFNEAISNLQLGIDRYKTSIIVQNRTEDLLGRLDELSSFLSRNKSAWTSRLYSKRVVPRKLITYYPKYTFTAEVSTPGYQDWGLIDLGMGERYKKPRLRGTHTEQVYAGLYTKDTDKDSSGDSSSGDSSSVNDTERETKGDPFDETLSTFCGVLNESVEWKFVGYYRSGTQSELESEQHSKEASTESHSELYWRSSRITDSEPEDIIDYDSGGDQGVSWVFKCSNKVFDNVQDKLVEKLKDRVADLTKLSGTNGSGGDWDYGSDPSHFITGPRGVTCTIRIPEDSVFSVLYFDMPFFPDR